MARFDRNAPFESVGGAPGVAYSQNGRYFNNGGYEVEIVKVGEGDNQRSIGCVKADATPALTADEEDEYRASTDQDVPPSQMHWRKLKAVVEQFGHKWTNREDAIAFLEGNNKEEDQP